MPKIQWLHYAENRLAPLCRKPNGSITPTGDTPRPKHKLERETFALAA
jgi:hypothetical protein